MKKITKIASMAAVALMMTLTNGCKKEEIPESAAAGSASEESGQRSIPIPIDKPVTVEVRMIGYDPGRYGSLECGLKSMSLHFVTQGQFPMSRWIDVPLRRLPMNLLNFNWKNPMNLADLNIPEGSLTEVRINFAENGLVAWNDHNMRYSVTARVTKTSVTIPASGKIVQGKKLQVFLGVDVAQSLNFEGGLHPLTIDPVVRRLLAGSDEEVIADNSTK